MSTRRTKVSFILPSQIIRVTFPIKLPVLLLPQQYLCQPSQASAVKKAPLAVCRIKLYAWKSQCICTVCLLITNSSTLCVAVTVICLTGMQNDLLKTYLSNSTMKNCNNDTKNKTTLLGKSQMSPVSEIVGYASLKLFKMNMCRHLQASRHSVLN